MTRPRLALLLVAVAISAAAAALVPLSLARDPLPGPGPGAAPATPDWRQVDRLISEQKLAEAAALLEPMAERARARGDDQELARILVRRTQIGIALGGFETAVEALRAEPWPEAPLARAQVELYDAHALVAYLDAYGWEIRQRERVVSGERLDLKLWTAEQIVAEADRAFARVWALREALGGLAPSALSELRPNGYPDRIRPTLRDAVAYLWADRLANTGHWSPGELAELWKLDLPALAEGRGVEPTAERLADPDLHPLAKLAAVLGDLERWHRGRGEAGAALEARLERLGHLHDAFSAEEDRAALRAALERSLPEFRDDPWWAMGRARLAAMTAEGAAPDALIRARELALEGEQAYPRSHGAQACRAERERIEAPSFQLASMSIDGPRERSVEITHRNLPRLHLRAYRLPDAPFGSEPVNWPGWNRDRFRKVLRTSPEAAWSVELPPTGDYRDHRSYATPPLDRRGRYLVVASAEPSFRVERNQLQAVELRLSELVLLRDPSFGQAPGADAVRVVEGATGAPVAGAEARLYRWRWEHRPELVATVRTDARGLARFRELPSGNDGQGIAVAVRHDGEEAVWSQGWWWRPNGPPGSAAGALVFTDRAIYRPGQTLYWKILAYEGEAAKGSFRPVEGRQHRVELVDPNGEVVATADARTNDFGTAAGELTIPTGRLLGAWRLRTSANGSAAIAVEEYKRPTFEVTLEAPESEPRLNRPLELTGEARYYFGLPVASGRVAWRVVREPLWEWSRHGWFGWRPPAPPRTVASGASELDADGRFTVAFTPEADERERDACGCFRFTVEAEATDDGGETRSASRSLAIGWVGVTLAVDGDPFLLGPRSERAWTVRRRSLDGEARPGASRWRLVELAQPERAPLPAELPSPVDPARERWATPGDRLSPRTTTAPASEQILAGWQAGAELANGALEHGEDGAAALALPALAAGAYRLIAETTDAHGETFTLERSFAVAGDRAVLAVPLELRFESPSVPVGGTARLFVHSGLPGQTIVLELVRGAEVRSRRTLVAGRDPVWIELPIARADRGGFGARATVVADHQVVSRSAGVSVPWEDKQLTVELATFRDKLEPGATETFRVRVKGPSGEPLGAGAAELLASMYDRSLDAFRPFSVPRPLALYPAFGAPSALQHDLGAAGVVWSEAEGWGARTSWPVFAEDAFVGIDPYGIGGPGWGGRRSLARGEVAYEGQALPAAAPAEARDAVAEKLAVAKSMPASRQEADASAAAAETPVALRADFSETAFWRPHLVTEADGTAAIEFTVPDSLTSWKLWVAAWTRELASGSVEQEVRTAKELMVRPYLPRFLREGDRAALKVVVNNASEGPLDGEVRFRIVDAETEEDLSAAFGLPAGGGRARFSAAPGAGDDLGFEIEAPRGLRTVAFRVEARAGGLSDGELRPLPVLPSRIRLAQSRFAALKGGERRELVFEDLRAEDPTRIDERMVVTVDGQLFYGMLDALPYLVDYPYECTEQTMNRFVSTGILGSLFDRYPAVGAMAQQLAERETRWERFDAADPNRRMALEETPWLRQARGGEGTTDEALLRVLDPAVARAVREDALGKLRKAQLPSGAFPWFPGGPPSPWMTLYLMYGFGRAADFGVEVPQDV
ncbi:MAG TPA: alpha-2-macroglobulin family protein, partial [Thermoanaerobaculia bacterium]|nr:alpha-2-macroglobulin family protein [Thermoanaerobaculia bacterium]